MKHLLLLFICAFPSHFFAQVIIDNGFAHQSAVRYDDELQKGVIFYEGFENAQRPELPQAWSTQSLSSSGFYTGTAGNAAGQTNQNGFWNVPFHGIFAMTNDDVCNCDKSKDRLILPSIDLEGVPQATVVFSAFQNGSSGQSAQIEISENGLTWSTLTEIPSHVEWKQYSAPIPHKFLKSGVRIRFSYNDQGNYASGLAIDDVYITSGLDPKFSMENFFSIRGTELGSGQFPYAIPLKQARYTGFQFGAIAMNSHDDLRPSKLKVTVDGPVSYEDSSQTYVVASNSSQHLKFRTEQGYTPYTKGHYLLNAEITADSTDSEITDNQYSATFNISDSSYTPINMAGENVVGVWLREDADRYGTVFQIFKADTSLALNLRIHPSSEPPARFVVKIFHFDTLTFSIFTTATIELEPEDIGTVKRIPLTHAFTRGKYIVAIEKELSPGRLVISAHRTLLARDSNAFTKKSGQLWRTFGYFPQMELIMPAIDTNCTGHIQATLMNETCPGLANGSIEASLLNDTGQISFEWSGSLGTNPSISNLNPGNYTLTATSNLGCTYTRTFKIDSAKKISIHADVAADSCARGSGKIALNINGGIGPYDILWNGMPGTTQITGMPSGQYEIHITDDAGCTLDTTLILPGTDSIVIQPTIINPNCGNSNGEIDLMATGTEPMEFTWNYGATGPLAQNLAAGVYTVTITDSIGCKLTTSIVVNDSGSASLSINAIEHVICGGDSTGGTNISVSLGAPPFTYEWDNGQSNQNLENAPAGNYTLTVTDDNGCKSIIQTEILAENALMQLFFNTRGNYCQGQSAGKAQAIVSGGLKPYSFNWSTSDTTEWLEELAAGTYSLTVTDSLGCTSDNKVTISQGIPLFVQLDSVFWDTTNNFIAESDVFISAYGGTPPFQYLWNDSIITQDLINVPIDTYHLHMTDQLGCAINFAYILENGPAGIHTTLGPNEQSLKIFPNPVYPGHIVQIEGARLPLTAEILDENGRSIILYKNRTELPIPMIQSGTYILRIKDKSSLWNKRFVIIQ